MKCWLCKTKDAEEKPIGIYCMECRLEVLAGTKHSVLVHPKGEFYLPGTDKFGKTQLDYFNELGEQEYNKRLLNNTPIVEKI